MGDCIPCGAKRGVVTGRWRVTYPTGKIEDFLDEAQATRAATAGGGVIEKVS